MRAASRVLSGSPSLCVSKSILKFRGKASLAEAQVVHDQTWSSLSPVANAVILPVPFSSCLKVFGALEGILTPQPVVADIALANLVSVKLSEQPLPSNVLQ